MKIYSLFCVVSMLLSFSVSLRAGGEKEIGDLQSKISRLSLPDIEFKDVPLVEAIRTIRQLTRDNDPGKTGVNIFLKLTDQTSNTLISLSLKEPDLTTAIAAIAAEANLNVEVHPAGLSLVPKK